MCEVLDRIEARGIEKGIEQGIKRGTLNTLISLVNDGILSIEEAAARVDMSVECFEKYMKWGKYKWRLPDNGSEKNGWLSSTIFFIAI